MIMIIPGSFLYLAPGGAWAGAAKGRIPRVKGNPKTRTLAAHSPTARDDAVPLVMKTSIN